jgi:hypothetical protein
LSPHTLELGIGKLAVAVCVEDVEELLQVLWRYVKVWVQEDALGLVPRPPRNLEEMEKTNSILGKEISCGHCMSGCYYRAG